MSSRFVSAGTDQAPSRTDVDWEKARQEVESKRNIKSTEPGKQEDGKSLYDVLQANKAAKQEQFEETSKLRNQFRTLDDSEVEFLDSIRESERVKENSIRQETAEQLDQFRKQKTATEQATADLLEAAKKTDVDDTKNLWAIPRKRRRDKAEVEGASGKAIKLSDDDQVIRSGASNSTVFDDNVDLPSGKTKGTDDTKSIQQKDQKIESSKSAGLGLDAYDSDDD